MSTASPMAHISIGSGILVLDECPTENNNFSFKSDIQSDSNKIVKDVEKTFIIDKKSEENITDDSILKYSLTNSNTPNKFNDNNENNLFIEKDKSLNNQENLLVKSIPTFFEKSSTIENSSESINKTSLHDLSELKSNDASTSISKNVIVNYVLKENAQRTQDLIKKQIIEIEKEISRRIQNKNIKQVIINF